MMMMVENFCKDVTNGESSLELSGRESGIFLRQSVSFWEAG